MRSSKPFPRLFALSLIMSLVAVVSGCENRSKATVSSGPPPAWELNLTMDGTPFNVPLEVMDVNLVEDNAYPEVFEITGSGVTLVGEFPLSIHVDYGENWERLKGQTIMISPTMEHPSVSSQSTLRLPDGTTAEVVGGNFTVNAISGTYAGSEGDITLSGSINLDVNTPTGVKSLSGTFAVHGVTWG